jgi:hypothetical protein
MYEGETIQTSYRTSEECVSLETKNAKLYKALENITSICSIIADNDYESDLTKDQVDSIKDLSETARFDNDLEL